MKFIELQDINGVRRVTLNRPDLHNAFNAEMIGELTEAFSDLPKGLRALVLRGNGKSVCAGADLTWMKSMVDYSFEENQKDSYYTLQFPFH